MLQCVPWPTNPPLDDRCIAAQHAQAPEVRHGSPAHARALGASIPRRRSPVAHPAQAARRAAGRSARAARFAGVVCCEREPRWREERERQCSARLTWRSTTRLRS